MTYQEFKKSGIDYKKGYSALLAKLDSLNNGGLQKAIAHCYRSYMGFEILKALEASKVAGKPLHYKVVNDFVKSFSNDSVAFYITTQEWSSLGKDSNICIYLRCRTSYVTSSETFYIRRTTEENTADWAEMGNIRADIVNPKDVERLYLKQKAENEKYRQAVEKLKEAYNISRNTQPWITEAVYVQVK